MTHNTMMMNSIQNTVTVASDALKVIAKESAQLEAECLLAHVLAVDRIYLKKHPEHILSWETEQKCKQLLNKRLSGMPLAYIVGKKEFWTVALTVTQDVLVPRPETEMVVETLLSKCPKNLPFPILELGTGSGAIAIALAKERPHWEIIATDRSLAALTVARENAAALGCHHIQFYAGDWFHAVLPLGLGPFSVIVSNPPYIAANDPHLADLALKCEPYGALCAGETGLEALTFIIENAKPLLAPEGQLCLEHGHDQSRALFTLLQKNGYHDCEQVRDLAKQPRVIIARG